MVVTDGTAVISQKDELVTPLSGTWLVQYPVCSTPFTVYGLHLINAMFGCTKSDGAH